MFVVTSDATARFTFTISSHYVCKSKGCCSTDASHRLMLMTYGTHRPNEAGPASQPYGHRQRTLNHRDGVSDPGKPQLGGMPLNVACLCDREGVADPGPSSSGAWLCGLQPRRGRKHVCGPSRPETSRAGNSLIGHVASGAHGHGNGQGNSAAAAATSETTTNMCLGIRLRLLLRLLTIDRCAPRPQKHARHEDRRDRNLSQSSMGKRAEPPWRCMSVHILSMIAVMADVISMQLATIVVRPVEWSTTRATTRNVRQSLWNDRCRGSSRRPGCWAHEKNVYAMVLDPELGHIGDVPRETASRAGLEITRVPFFDSECFQGPSRDANPPLGAAEDQAPDPGLLMLQGVADLAELAGCAGMADIAGLEQLSLPASEDCETVIELVSDDDRARSNDIGNDIGQGMAGHWRSNMDQGLVGKVGGVFARRLSIAEKGLGRCLES
ncbi:hypothetical protein EV126DRAFT_463249 [Verticillium dahliae]|nr:hypothetical protein EV126DRAFT_463249 [Verticillium dahliae]